MDKCVNCGLVVREDQLSSVLHSGTECAVYAHLDWNECATGLRAELAALQRERDGLAAALGSVMAAIGDRLLADGSLDANYALAVGEEIDAALAGSSDALDKMVADAKREGQADALDQAAQILMGSLKDVPNNTMGSVTRGVFLPIIQDLQKLAAALRSSSGSGEAQAK